MDDHDIVTITIGEKKIEINLWKLLVETPEELLPQWIAQHGALLGDAEAEKIKLDGMYRKWRGEQGNKYRKMDKSLPEWRVKQRIEAQDAFLNYKHAEAACERNVTILRNVICGLLAKTGVRDPNSKVREEEL